METAFWSRGLTAKLNDGPTNPRPARFCLMRKRLSVPAQQLGSAAGRYRGLWRPSRDHETQGPPSHFRPFRAALGRDRPTPHHADVAGTNGGAGGAGTDDDVIGLHVPGERKIKSAAMVARDIPAASINKKDSQCGCPLRESSTPTCPGMVPLGPDDGYIAYFFNAALSHSNPLPGLSGTTA